MVYVHISFSNLDDYESFNPEHDVSLLCLWLAKMVGDLCLRVLTSERFSLFSFISFLFLAFLLQAPEHHIQPSKRFFIVFCRKLC